MTTRIKWIICGGMFLLWGTLLIGYFLDPRDPIRKPLRYKTGQTASQVAQPQETPHVLATFHQPQTISLRFQKPRNIFAPLAGRPSDPVRPPNRASRKATTIQSRKPSSQDRAPASSTPSSLSPTQVALERARRQLERFRFLGYLTQHGDQRVFLSNGQAIYIVRQGEIVEGTVQVEAIHPNTVVLSTFVPETRSRVQATLSLTKEAS